MRTTEEHEAPPTEDAIRRAVSELITADDDAIEILCTYDLGKSAIVLLHPMTLESNGGFRTAKKLADELSTALSNGPGSGKNMPGGKMGRGSQAPQGSYAASVLGQKVKVMGPLPEQAAGVLAKALEVLSCVCMCLYALSVVEDVDCDDLCTSLFVCMYACMYACTYVSTYVCTHMYLCMYECKVFLCVCMYLCVCKNILVYVCTYV